jgi:VanZ family protein
MIVVLTVLPGTAIPKLPEFMDLFQPDKLVHLFLFGVFVFFLLRGFRRPGNPEWVSRNVILVALAIGVTLSGLTELVQKLPMISRVASPWDFLANTIGCMVGWGIFRMFDP